MQVMRSEACELIVQKWNGSWHSFHQELPGVPPLDFPDCDAPPGWTRTSAAAFEYHGDSLELYSDGVFVIFLWLVLKAIGVVTGLFSIIVPGFDVILAMHRDGFDDAVF